MPSECNKLQYEGKEIELSMRFKHSWIDSKLWKRNTKYTHEPPHFSCIKQQELEWV